MSPFKAATPRTVFLDTHVEAHPFKVLIATASSIRLQVLELLKTTSTQISVGTASKHHHSAHSAHLLTIRWCNCTQLPGYIATETAVQFVHDGKHKMCYCSIGKVLINRMQRPVQSSSHVAIISFSECVTRQGLQYTIHAFMLDYYYYVNR